MQWSLTMKCINLKDSLSHFLNEPLKANIYQMSKSAARAKTSCSGRGDSPVLQEGTESSGLGVCWKPSSTQQHPATTSILQLCQSPFFFFSFNSSRRKKIRKKKNKKKERCRQLTRPLFSNDFSLLLFFITHTGFVLVTAVFA